MPKALEKLLTGRKPHATDFLPSPLRQYVKFLAYPLNPYHKNTTPYRHPLKAAKQVLTLTNRQRERYARRPLALSRTLTEVARKHSVYQASIHRMTHRGRGGLGNRFRKGGYQFRTAAENVAQGQLSPEWVVDSWMRSSGHRKNILKRDVRDMGAWVEKDSRGVCYWTQVFGSRR